jgi:hypothetical protein
VLRSLPDIPPSSAGRVKGISIGELAKGIREELGADELRRMVAELPPEWRAGLDPERERLGILIGSWYPIEILNALYDQLVAGRSPAERHRLAQQVGKEYVARLLRGIYRFIFDVLATPARYVANAQRIWDQGCDTGKLELALVEAGRVESRLFDWPGHHPFGCAVSFHIGVEIYRAMGCKRVAGMLRCKSETGAADCRASHTWHG